MRKFYIIILACFLSAAGSEGASACSCVASILTDRDEAAREFKNAKIVFEGQVLSVERPKAPDLTGTPPEARPIIINNLGVIEITFRVLKSYKGPEEPTILVYSGSAGSDCAIHARAGQKWFVYGFEGNDGKIYIETCSRSGELERSGADVRNARGEPATGEDLVPADEKMRLLLDPTLLKRGATVSGAVRRADKQRFGNDGVLVTLWSLDTNGHRNGNVTAEQYVNLDGTYVVCYLPPGRYLLTARDSAWTPATRLVANYGVIELKEGARLDDLQMVLYPEPLGAITVHVDPPEALHTGMFVVLTDTDSVSASLSRQIYPHNETGELSSTGDALFEKMPYGSYNAIVLLSGVAHRAYESPIPGWCQNDTQVNIERAHAEVVVHLHKCQEK